MKFITIVFAMTFFVVATTSAQVSLGIRGGYVNSGLASSANISRSGTANLNNWQVGIYADIPLFKGGYLQPGLSYVVKGARLESTIQHPSYTFSSGTTNIRLKYLEFPVNMVYKVPVGFGQIVLGAGPYAAYCVRGHYDMAIYNEGQQVQSISQRVNFKQSPNVFSTGMDLQRWDAGLNFTAGIQLNCFITLGVNYSLGLMDIDRSPGTNLKNKYFGVSIGMLLDREDW
ncbi:outer membrane protein with beta-barrel domain [Chitinophaga niastensis]|uniref:Outer membrane protein with beta-barrel domain n=1 Tax=Chitinophaga niastensis TaxID=536980 RepID=A0A2P8HSL0_CHINA|nr:outer membrane beta-barrel protein [Chitinophaga niastensis]PSL49182.1 outer membrane protein with beta-barrel domain [Chitinophaga niastensis]